VILGKRILSDPDFPEDTFLFLNSGTLSLNDDPATDSRASTDFSAFELPQLILKQSWQKEHKRFQAAIVRSNNNEAILCSKSYITIHVDQEYSQFLEAACLSYTSKLAVYYLLLSSGRFSTYRPEPNVEDLLRVPIPEYREEIVQNLETFDDVDHQIYDAFSLKESEKVLIEDIFNYTLLDFKGDRSSPGRQKTHRISSNLFEAEEELELKQYCEYFMRVIKAGFGQDKGICATIFQELTGNYLPIRLVAIYLNKSIHDGIKVETINSQVLLDRLNQLNNLFVEQGGSDNGGIFYQRVARVYTSTEWRGEQVPTVYLIKPDKIRYWTRSMALRDADEVSADIMAGHTYLSTNLEAVPLA
jgi:hypothetical protein